MSINDEFEIKDSGPYGDNFVVRFELQGMKHAIIQHINAHNDAIKAQIEKVCGDVVTGFDLEVLVKHVAEREMKRALTSTISDAISHTVQQAVHDATFGMVGDTVRKVILEELKRESKEKK